MTERDQSSWAVLAWIIVFGSALGVTAGVWDRASGGDLSSAGNRAGQWFDTSTFGAIVTWSMVGFVYFCFVATVVMSTVRLVMRHRLVARARSTTAWVETCTKVESDGCYQLRVIYFFEGKRTADVLSDVWTELVPGDEVEVWFDPQKPERADLVERFPTVVSRVKAMTYTLPAWTAVLWSAALLIQLR